MTDATNWDHVGFVESSKYRVLVALALLEQPKTPSQIVESPPDGYDVDDTARVSRALGQLRDRNLVDLVVDERTHKGRIYDLTDGGREIAEVVRDRL